MAESPTASSQPDPAITSSLDVVILCSHDGLAHHSAPDSRYNLKRASLEAGLEYGVVELVQGWEDVLGGLRPRLVVPCTQDVRACGGHIVQQLLDLGYNVLSCGPRAVRRSSNKADAKHDLKAAGVLTADFRTLDQASIRAFGGLAAVERWLITQPLPLVLKPVHGHNATGLQRVTSTDELPQLLANAFCWGREIMLERLISGGERSVFIPAPDSLSLGQAVVDATKMWEPSHPDRRRIYTPATDLGSREALVAEAAARRAYDALGCDGPAIVDVIVDVDGLPWVLEVNTVLTYGAAMAAASASTGSSAAMALGALMSDRLAGTH